jgi:uncharacterized membrane protein YhaH (DUF805 family)
MINWYIAVLKKYAVFQGRASRKEFWTFMFVNFVIMFAIALIEGGEGIPVIGYAYSFAVLVPSFAVGVRRLHDTGKSGWWILLTLVPLAPVILLIFYVMDSQDGENQYGASPKDIPDSLSQD